MTQQMSTPARSLVEMSRSTICPAAPAPTSIPRSARPRRRRFRQFENSRYSSRKMKRLKSRNAHCSPDPKT